MSLTTFILFSLLFSLDMGLNAKRASRDMSGESSGVSSKTLRLVHILHRHGDRSPVHAYKNDIYNESSWPQGFGQLSKVGMNQTHNLGVFLRQRYVDTGFLNPEYKRTELYVRSTDMDRTLMSAYCVLSGMFPPDENQTWSKSIAWQPIPVHTTTREHDTLLHGNCPEYAKKTDAAHATNPFVTEVMDKYKEKYEYISNHSGEANSWKGIHKVLDPLFCQYASNYTLPDWVDNDTMTTVLQLLDLYNKASRMDMTNYAYLLYGPLLGEIIGHMVNVTSGENTQTTKFYEYSAHDSNVQGLLVTMGLFNDRQPPYRSCILIELHEQTEGHFVVQILYRNDSDHVPYLLKLKHCDELCPLEKFQQIMNSSIPKDSDLECGRTVPVLTPQPSFITSGGPAAVIAGILTLILFLFVVIGGFLCCRYRNKLRESHDYERVPMELS